MIQETKLKTKGKLSEIDGIKDFQIFELVRKNSNGAQRDKRPLKASPAIIAKKWYRSFNERC